MSTAALSHPTKPPTPPTPPMHPVKYERAMPNVRESFASRLRDAMRQRGHLAQRGSRFGVDVTALAAKAGVTYQMAMRYLAGDAMPDPDRIASVATWLNVSVPWLRDGINDTNIAPVASTTRVPVLQWRDIGAWLDQSINNNQKLMEDWVVVEAPVGDRTFAAIVSGDMMIDQEGHGIPDGATIVVDPDATPKSGDYVVVELSEGEQPILRQLVVDGPNQYLRPLNPRYPVTLIVATPFRWGVVRESLQRKRYL